DLLRGSFRVHLLGKFGLLGRLLALQFIQSLGDRFLRLLQFLGGLTRFLRGGIQLVLVQILLGGFHVLGGFGNLLGSLRRGFLDLFADFLGLRRQLFLLFGQLLAGLGGRLLGLILGLIGNLALLLGQLVELLGRFFQLGDVLLAFFDRGHLLGYLFLGFFQRLDGLVLLGDRLGRRLGFQLLSGLLHFLGGLVQGGFDFLLAGQRRFLHILCALGQVGLLVGQFGNLEVLFFAGGFLGLVAGRGLLLQKLFDGVRRLLQRGERIVFLLFGGGQQLVHFLLGLLQGSDGLFLGLRGFCRLVLRQGFLGLLHGLLGRLDFL